MKPVIIPQPDVNSETALVVEWSIANGQAVTKGQKILEIETSKAVHEITAPDTGFLLQVVPLEAEFSLKTPVAYLFEDLDALKAHQQKQAKKPSEAKTVLATKKAMERASELGVDLNSLQADGMITVEMVERAAQSKKEPSQLPALLKAPKGVERVLLIGGGLGATQVIDIFRVSKNQMAVGILDDNAERWGQSVYEVPIVGGAARLEALYKEKSFDAVVIAISTSVPARTKFRSLCEAAKIPLTNAIDPTARICSEVKMGRGNVICAFCHLGTSTQIGDNNFLSAYNSYDHHNVLGSDSSTGPGCATSGLVHIGNRVRMGTGIFIEPYVELGDDVRVASGAIILTSVPANHTVKRKVSTMSVVGNR